MCNIDINELRGYKVKHGTIEECNEVVRLLEELGERVYEDASWKPGTVDRILSLGFYYSIAGRCWVGTSVTSEYGYIEASDFINLLKTSSSTPKQTTLEAISEYFKTRSKQCTTN